MSQPTPLTEEKKKAFGQLEPTLKQCVISADLNKAKKQQVKLKNFCVLPGMKQDFCKQKIGFMRLLWKQIV